MQKLTDITWNDMEDAIKRDNISSEKFLEREQATLEFKKYKFDYVINNSDITKMKGR